MSLTYLRAQLAAVVRFWFVLVGAVILLYLIGDVTENLDAWTGARGSVLMRLADVGLGLAELLLRVVGLLTAFALVFAWARSATQGELTSVEAAGYSPLVHWLAVTPILVLSVGATMWFYADGQRQLSIGRAALESLRQGAAQISADQRLWPAQDGQWLIGDARQQVQGRVRLAPDGHSLMEFERWRPSGGDRLRVDAARVFTADSRPPSLPTRPGKPAIADADARTGADRGIEQGIFSLLMLLVAYGVLVRHGRGGGLAAQVITGVLGVTLLWILSQVVDYVPQSQSMRAAATLVATVGVLTILSLFRRIRSL